uniref:Uncharacterized protein n=1 Tax=Melopsittacus undulatus TaxID=13146 RepID=A0A8C6JZH6_MELUD
MQQTKSEYSPDLVKETCISPSVLKLPVEESIGSHHTPFQFDRHALARISTSPTLRRLRMTSASQALSLQDCSDTAQLGNLKEYNSSLHHICKSPPRCTTTSSLLLPSCVHAKLLSSKAKPETTSANSVSASPRSNLPSQKGPLSNGNISERLQNSQRMVEPNVRFPTTKGRGLIPFLDFHLPLPALSLTAPLQF